MCDDSYTDNYTDPDAPAPDPCDGIKSPFLRRACGRLVDGCLWAVVLAAAIVLAAIGKAILRL